MNFFYRNSKFKN